MAALLRRRRPGVTAICRTGEHAETRYTCSGGAVLDQAGRRRSAACPSARRRWASPKAPRPAGRRRSDLRWRRARPKISEVRVDRHRRLRHVSGLVRLTSHAARAPRAALRSCTGSAPLGRPAADRRDGRSVGQTEAWGGCRSTRSRSPSSTADRVDDQACAGQRRAGNIAHAEGDLGIADRARRRPRWRAAAVGLAGNRGGADAPGDLQRSAAGAVVLGLPLAFAGLAGGPGARRDHFRRCRTAWPGSPRPRSCWPAACCSQPCAASLGGAAFAASASCRCCSATPAQRRGGGRRPPRPCSPCWCCPRSTPWGPGRGAGVAARLGGLGRDRWRSRGGRLPGELPGLAVGLGLRRARAPRVISVV